MPATIQLGSHVSGPFGDLHQVLDHSGNPVPHKRQKRYIIEGTVLHATGSRSCIVKFDNGPVLKCSSNRLTSIAQASLSGSDDTTALEL